MFFILKMEIVPGPDI